MGIRISVVAGVMSLVVLGSTSVEAQQSGSASAGHGTFVNVAATSLEWSPIQPPGFDEGMEIAVVSGDPSVAGEPYVIRLRFRDGYRFPPHWHPVAENLTVTRGEFLLAMGEKADESQLKSYTPGDFIFIEGRHPHFGGAKGVTTIQLHGTGPFDIIVVGSPEDKR